MANDAGLAVPAATPSLDERSLELRRLVVRALDGGARGHIGSSMSLVEIMRVLYDDILRYRAEEPDWPLRDRCILSKGHGCIAQYVMLAEKGFFPHAVLDTFCRRDSILGGHPEAKKVPGVEASTGALGHGLPIGVGRALALRYRGSKARVFVVAGDGEVDEGAVWEAALSAAKHGLDNLVLLIDYNKIQSAGPVAEILPLEPLADKWRAFGFAVGEVDGHDVAALRRVLRALPLIPGEPSAVICHTVKGKGLAFAENDANWHHKSSIKEDLVKEMYDALAAL
jgi:transketolase